MKHVTKSRVLLVIGIAAALLASGWGAGTSEAREGAQPRAVGTTAYGRALLAKLICVGAVVAFGGYKRQVLVPAVERADQRRAWHRLRRTLVAETLVMALGVLLATAALTSGGL